MSSFIDNIPSPVGRPPKYTAESLWQKFLEYVQWADQNPIESFNRVTGKGDTQAQKSKGVVQDKVHRPYTLIAFMTFAGITNWTEFKASQNAQKPVFLRVIRAIENAIKSQQIDGALVGVYNPNLTARINGIADSVKTDNTHHVAPIKKSISPDDE